MAKKLRHYLQVMTEQTQQTFTARGGKGVQRDSRIITQRAVLTQEFHESHRICLPQANS
jgi:hypothetical protein